MLIHGLLSWRWTSVLELDHTHSHSQSAHPFLLISGYERDEFNKNWFWRKFHLRQLTGDRLKPLRPRLLLDRVQGVMLKIGCPMAVKHNEASTPVAFNMEHLKSFDHEHDIIYGILVRRDMKIKMLRFLPLHDPECGYTATLLHSRGGRSADVFAAPARHESQEITQLRSSVAQVFQHIPTVPYGCKYLLRRLALLCRFGG